MLIQVYISDDIQLYLIQWRDSKYKDLQASIVSKNDLKHTYTIHLLKNNYKKNPKALITNESRGDIN